MIISLDNREEMMNKTYKGYLIDLDGTVYNGTLPIPTARKFVEELQEKDIPFLFLTNNATKEPEDVVTFLKEICNIHSDKEHVYTSGMAAIDYVKQNHSRARTLIVGEAALIKQAKEASLVLTEEDVEVVIQALDRDTTYEKLMTASIAIRNGAEFVVTNTDSNLPTEFGFVPGSGALTAFLKASTQKEPTIIGKPHSPIMEGALQMMGLEKDEVAMIGDNYHTDILAGIHYGIDTILTLTGFTQRIDLEKKEEKPTHIIEDLSEWML